MPRISVIMPVYNAGIFVKQSIETVLNQTCDDFELLVIDDCGTDDSMRVVEEFSDRRIRILKNDRNRGIAYSRNRGLKAATGEFIALLDHDDLATRERFQKQADFLDCHSDIDVVGGNAQWIDENNKVIRDKIAVISDPNYIKMMFLFRNLYNNSEVMFRRKFVEENHLHYRENCFGMEDFCFWIECSKKGKMSNIEDLILKKRVFAANETSRVWSLHQDERRKKYAELQAFSIRSSGYDFTDGELQILSKCIREDGVGVCHTNEELEGFYKILKKFIAQTKERKMSILPAMQNFFRGILLEMVSNMNDEQVWK